MHSPRFALDSPLGECIRALRAPTSLRHWGDGAHGPRNFFIGRAFDSCSFIGAWDAVRVAGCGNVASAPPRIAWSTPFNPDYTRRSEARHDTWELRTDTGEVRVARLDLIFRYCNAGPVPRSVLAGPAHWQDLVVVRWLELNGADTNYANQHNGTRTFEVRRPAAAEIVPVRWLVRSRLVVPCGEGSRLAGALWVWDE